MQLYNFLDEEASRTMIRAAAEQSLLKLKESAEFVAACNKAGNSEHVIERGIRWKFIPPLASHLGEVWE